MDRKPSSNWARRAIVIRKRTLDETRDLSLRVLGKQFKPLTLYYLALALPVYLVDVVLWAFFAPPLSPIGGGINSFPYAEAFGSFWRQVDFLSFIYLTIWLETAFIGTLATQYLGIWLFASDARELKRKKVVGSWKSRLFQLVYYLIVTRLIRVRFFYAETILLEQTPFRSSSDRLSTNKRVRNINGGSWGTFAGAFLSTETYLACGVLFGSLTLFGLLRAIVPDALPRWILFDFVVFPALAFGCRLYGVAYNFFSYVNYRIVSEGWDLDLAFKIEAGKHANAEDPDDKIPQRFRRSKTLAPMLLDLDANAENLQTENSTPEVRS